MENVVNFEENESIGRVTQVDTTRVFIRVDDHEQLKSVIVGNLLAIQGSTGHQLLIAIVERITRVPGDYLEVALEDAEEGPSDFESMQDTIRAVLVGTYFTRYGSGGPKFKRGADSCPQIDQPAYLLRKANLTSFMNVLSHEFDSDQALTLGKFAIDESAVAIANGNRFFQRHAAILGSTGSGKSWTVASILECASRLEHANIIVFDLHGEYSPLTDRANGGYAKSYRIAGPGDLSVERDGVLFLPYWLLNREEMMSMVLDRNDQNAPNQASRFTTHVHAEKHRFLDSEGRSDIAATFTVDSPLPFDLNQVVSLLAEDDTQMVQGKTGPKQGEWFGKLSRFISRLQAKIDDRRLGFLFKPPASAMRYDWLAGFALDMLGTPEGKPGIKVIDFSEVPSDVLPLVIAVFARMLYDVQLWLKAEKRKAFCLVCDEAHLYLPTRDEADAPLKRALEIFERIAKEGRKYGVGLLVVSQRPSDVSRTILSQCNNFIALRLTNEQDQAAVRSSMPDSMSGVAEVLPLLDIGEALVLGDSVLLPSRVRLNEPTIKPASVTRDFWTEWNEMASDNEAIRNAVEALRAQSRQTHPTP